MNPEEKRKRIRKGAEGVLVEYGVNLRRISKEYPVGVRTTERYQALEANRRAALNKLFTSLDRDGVRGTMGEELPEPDITMDSFPQQCNETCHLVEQQNMINQWTFRLVEGK